MTESIETFVSKLHEEGVQAGEAAAEEIRSQARAEAETIVQEARKEAERIISEAEQQAKGLQEKSQSELRLAARDAILKLRTKLVQILQAVLVGPVKQELSNSEFLVPILRDIIMQYAQADIDRTSDIRINVTPDQHKKLVEWAIDEIHQAAHQKGMSIDLKGTLKQAGFEYQVKGATVEITVDSVVEMLMQFIAPNLQELLDQVIKDTDEQELL